MVGKIILQKASLPCDFKEFYNGQPYIQSQERNDRLSSIRITVLKWLQTAFLPEGYPESVSADYLSFQVWDTIQGLSSYVRGMLTSQAILKGVGIGNQSASALAAAFQFFVRDLTGMLGGILFAYFQGSSFDNCAKQWRLFADITNDFGMAVELASPFFPSFFLVMACIGSIARSVTGVAGGATRAALTQHFARQGNAADIAAKEQSQETANTMLGMVLGMAFTHLTAEHLFFTWLLFILLTLLHIAANVQAMRCLVLHSLNGPRLHLLLEEYLAKGSLLTPAQVAKLEDLTPPAIKAAFASLFYSRPGLKVEMGARFSDLVGPSSAAKDQTALIACSSSSNVKRYVLRVSEGPRILVAFHRNYTPSDALQAHIHCLTLQRLYTLSKSLGDLEQEGSKWMDDKYADLHTRLLSAGWREDIMALPRPAWTAEWELKRD